MATKTVETSGAALLQKDGEEENDLGMAAGASQAIPEREAWLYQNIEARETVLSSPARLRKGLFSDSPPDVDAVEPWMEQLISPLIRGMDGSLRRDT